MSLLVIGWLNPKKIHLLMFQGLVPCFLVSLFVEQDTYAVCSTPYMSCVQLHMHDTGRIRMQRILLFASSNWHKEERESLQLIWGHCFI